jgi:two-component system sensor histidine kinase YesM
MIIMMCWLAPVLTLGISNALLYNVSYKDKLDSSVTNELSFAAAISAERLESALLSLKDISADEQLLDILSSYSAGVISYDDFNIQVRQYFKSKAPSLSPLDMVDLITGKDLKKHIYITSSGTLGSWLDYQNRTINEILSSFGTSSYSSVIYAEDGNIYFAQRMYISTAAVNNISESSYAILVIKLDSDDAFKPMKNNKFWGDNVLFSIREIPYQNESTGYLSPEVKRLAPQDLLTEINKVSTRNVSSGDNNSRVFSGGEIRRDRVVFRYAVMLDTDIIYHENTAFIATVIAVLIIIIPVLIIAMVYVYFKLNKPITEMVHITAKIREGELGNIIDYKSDDEIGYLVASFNEMSCRLKELFDKVYLEEMAAKDSKILALQSQINPHFLNNTLELMNWKARMAGEESISKMINALSMILDARMNRSAKQLIEFSEELECVDSYLYIIGVRFGGKVEVEFDVDPDSLEVPIPPLILQPLIENAVNHGIEPKGGGKIEISAAVEDGELHISIENDGAELSAVDIDKINRLLNSTRPAASVEFNQESKLYRLGIRNVDERLRLIYGSRYGLTIKKLQNGHTLNEIVMPIMLIEQK